MKFITLVGLPGSGKSTKAEELEKQGYVIYSSDAIRNELNLHSINDTKKVYDILHERLLESIKEGKNIVYDSTNLTIARRIEIINLINEYQYEKICYVFIVPINVCKYRNSFRKGYSKVNDWEYNIMQKIFTIPTSDEGWDKIILDIQDEKIQIK